MVGSMGCTGCGMGSISDANNPVLVWNIIKNKKQRIQANIISNNLLTVDVTTMRPKMHHPIQRLQANNAWCPN